MVLHPIHTGQSLSTNSRDDHIQLYHYVDVIYDPYHNIHHPLRIWIHVHCTYLIRPGTVHDELIDDKKRAMDTIITTQAGASVTLGGTLCHTIDGFSIGPLKR